MCILHIYTQLYKNLCECSKAELSILQMFWIVGSYNKPISPKQNNERRAQFPHPHGVMKHSYLLKLLIQAQDISPTYTKSPGYVHKKNLNKKWKGAARTQAPTVTNYDVGSITWTDLKQAPLRSAMEVTSLGHGPSWSPIDPVQVSNLDCPDCSYFIHPHGSLSTCFYSMWDKTA